MSNIKRHSLLILMAMLILLIMPMSFAVDADNNATVQQGSDVSADDVGISDVYEIQAEGSSFALADSEHAGPVALDCENDNAVGSEIKYVSTPSVDGNSSVEYLINGHATVTITVESDMLNQFESYDKLYAWIGDDYKQINVMANEASATVDLKDLSDQFRFEEGQTYTIYFHPDIYDLNNIGIGEGEYVFNPLTVEIIGTYTPEPTVVYTSTPKVGDKSAIRYIIGDDTIVNVSVVYDESYQNNAGFSGRSMRIFINGDKTGTVIRDVKANATAFTVNLADYITEEGSYNISFSPGDSTLSWVFYGVDNYVVELNNLTVKAVTAGTTSSYVSTPVPASVDYAIGKSSKVVVNVEYDSYFEDDLADLSIFVYINGEETVNRVKINGVYADATSFEFDLATIADKLVVGENTLTFHPHPGALPFDEPYTFNPLTVTARELAVVYETSVTPYSVDYVIGGASVVTVSADYDPIYAEDLGFATMFVYINGEETANRVEISGVAANATSFEFDLATIADKLAVGENTLTFHPHPGALEGTVSGDYVFNPLTVIASEPIETSIAAGNLVMNYKDGSAWAVTLTDADGNAISDAVVKIGIKINGVDKVYSRRTNADGVASLPINSAPGEYAVNATFDGDNTYAGSFAEATVTVNPSAAVLTADDLVMGYRDGSAWTVTLTDASGKAISNVYVKVGLNINGVDKVYSRKTNDGGVASLSINLASGTYAVNATFEGNAKYGAAFVNATVTVNKNALTISAEDLTMTYKDGSSYKVNVIGADGNAVANVKVKVTLGSKAYTIKTDSNGTAQLPIGLSLGNYTVSATVSEANYESNTINNAISVTTDSLTISADDVNMTYKDGTAYEVQLVDGQGNPVALAKQIVKITVKGKTYERKTDANGIAKLPINLAAGAYVIKAEYNGIEISNNVTVVKE